MIPKKIHQIWIGDQSKKPNKHMQTWIDKNPNWEYICWDENMIEGLGLYNIKTYNKYYKEKCFNGCANVARVEIVNKYGGIYIDADSIANNTLDDLSNLDFFAVYSPNIKNRVGNAFFGSVKNNKILEDYIEEIPKLEKIHPSWNTTGGTLFGKVIEKHKSMHLVLPSYSFYLENKRGKKTEVCGKNYGTHYWGTTFNRYDMETMGKNCKFDIKTGIKKYKKKEMCDFAYNAQLKAYELGVAPKVIRRVDEFSYQTDIADTSFFMENFKKGIYYNKIFPEIHNKLKDIFKDSPNKWGPDGVDLARHNLGLYEGRVVMIDFY